LRQRRFNCHMTEPPSWRRSTLNLGKIVCNKCGLSGSTRTHLRLHHSWWSRCCGRGAS
ncbi:hypothetical protein FIBSPDRAFT_723725, partial [Athelia psychrophila]